MKPARVRLERDEHGQVTVLILAFVVCLLLAVSVVIDISGSYLRRQSATSLADGAALSASDAAAAVAIYGDENDEFVAIDEHAAREAVESYLRAVDAFTTYPGLDVRVSVDRFTITVALQVPYRLPVHVPGVKSTVDIHATSSAVMPIY